MEKKRSEVTELIRAQEKAEVSRAEQLLNQLEQEIADLKRRVTELEQLTHTHDHIHFLQSFPSLCVSPGCDDSPSFTLNLSFDGVRKSLSDLKKRVEQICEEKFSKICPQDFCYLTLDPNTAHPLLTLSEKNRVVTRSKTKQQYSDHSERFESRAQVLCKESYKKMAEAGISADQDQFSCPVCLDLLKDPVTTPCGHNFCKVCINGFWDKEDQRSVYSCPQCRETFRPRPVLRRNNMLAEVVEELKKTEMSVKCDSCIGRKRKAVKSCLVCLASYCKDHLQPHYQSPAFKKHKLVEACAELQEKICSEHDKLMEIYCRTDQSFICYLCTMDQHKGHDTVSTKTERTEKQNELKREQMKFQQRIQENQKKVQKLKQTVDTIKIRSQEAVDDSERIFTELISSMEKKRSEVTELIRAQEKAEVSRAERLLNQLEQEIADLQRRVTEMEQLSHKHDDIHFLQSFPSLCVSLGCDDSPSFTLNLSFDGVRKSLSDLKKQVNEICEEEFNKIHPQDFCYLTLDPNTAHPELILSEKNRVVTRSKTKQRYSEHPERFESHAQVLCKESVSGHCYWEVEWSGVVSISVSYEDISRKGRGNECVFGFNSQSWSLQCSSSSVSFWHNNIETKLRGSASSRIGVYVDHSAGTLSFYSIFDMMSLLHRVHTTFTQPLYAGFWIQSYDLPISLCDRT
ncbi:hypothetical protein QTP86_019215 [Hemibagrus guttatus]|nr:hypothetical protein QTP86_019215 [Hemibagrus guttatus]